MQQLWKPTVMNIVYGLIGGLVAGLLAGVFLFVTPVLYYVFIVVGLAANVWVIINLNKFKGIQNNESDKSAINLVFIANILSLAGSFFGLIPVVGWILSLLLGIAAAITLLLGYSKFAKSTYMNATGLSGASLLKVSAIISLCAAVIAIIPVIGTIIALLAAIAVIILTFIGWTKVSNGAQA